MNSQSNKDINQKTEDRCPLCKGTGWITHEDVNGREVSKSCKCREEKIISNRLRFANIPEAYKDMELKTFRMDVYKQKKSIETINFVIDTVSTYLKELEYIKQKGIGLYVYSNTKGSGKTRLVASIANELMNNYKMQVKFAVSTTILNEIKNTDNKDSEYTESKLLDHLYTTEVLVIDDFGTEKITEWVDEKYFDIINERYLNKRITIFTSNYSLKELKYNERIKSRISERVYEIPFPEESIREHIAEKNKSDMLKRL